MWFIDKNKQNSIYVITNIAKIYISLCFTQKCLLKWCLYSNYPHMFFPKHPTFKRRPIDYFAYLWISLNPLLKCFKLKPQWDQLNPCSKDRGSNPIKLRNLRMIPSKITSFKGPWPRWRLLLITVRHNIRVSTNCETIFNAVFWCLLVFL